MTKLEETQLTSFFTWLCRGEIMLYEFDYSLTERGVWVFQVENANRQALSMKNIMEEFGWTAKRKSSVEVYDA